MTKKTNLLALCAEIKMDLDALHIEPKFVLLNQEQKVKLPKILKKFDDLASLLHDEKRMGDFLTQIINKSREEVIELIKKDNEATINDKKALEIIKFLKSFSEKHRSLLNNKTEFSSIYQFQRSVSEKVRDLRNLLMEYAEIWNASRRIIQDLELLMKQVYETENKRIVAKKK